MVELRSVCEDILEDVEGSLGCAAIDLQTGNTLAAVYRAGAVLDARGVDVISLAVAEMFHGKLIRQFHRAWSGGAAAPERFVREVQMATANSYQFMSVVPGWDDCLLVLITDRSVSLGLGWMAVHQGLSRIAELPRPDAPAPARTAPVRTPPRVEAPTATAQRVPEARPRPTEPPRAPDPAPRSGAAGTGTRAPAAPPTPPEPAPTPSAAPAPAAPPDPAPPPPADTAPAAPGGARQTRRQRTYRGVPLAKREAEGSEEDTEVPMGPRGRMFTPRR